MLHRPFLYCICLTMSIIPSLIPHIHLLHNDFLRIWLELDSIYVVVGLFSADFYQPFIHIARMLHNSSKRFQFDTQNISLSIDYSKGFSNRIIQYDFNGIDLFQTHQNRHFYTKYTQNSPERIQLLINLLRKFV